MIEYQDFEIEYNYKLLLLSLDTVTIYRTLGTQDDLNLLKIEQAIDKKLNRFLESYSYPPEKSHFLPEIPYISRLFSWIPGFGAGKPAPFPEALEVIRDTVLSSELVQGPEWHSPELRIWCWRKREIEENLPDISEKVRTYLKDEVGSLNIDDYKWLLFF
jgi:hypothetical protein